MRLVGVLGLALALDAHSGSEVWPRTLIVGPERELKVPSAAAAKAADGDVIEIERSADEAGYFDCAVWRANRLLIKGRSDGVVITDKTCQGKALFVTAGDSITVRNLTFARARAPERNGAGIRAEGADLRVESSRFVDNEEGILAASSPRSSMVILDSEFIDNGRCADECAHGVYVNESALLRIERSVFRGIRDGHAVKSRARRTVLVGNRIADGETGTSSYLVDVPIGGALVMRGNVLEKGLNSSNHSGAISIGEEGVSQPTEEITILENRFANDMNVPTVFVLNFTATRAKLSGNVLTGQVTPLSGDGSADGPRPRRRRASVGPRQGTTAVGRPRRVLWAADRRRGGRGLVVSCGGAE
jgi:hypothetical protein